ncbi:hypothetical protein PAPYR_1029 [Paratrimastix pyriformis]|uniref:Uncharacterized protein n=1 Tax=Paratrimastix pyriformis TaxID=342808 RepID=A0ABQ8UTD9_9EUKA|nr:hypothetical protein PAPYR_1029 [Paratrimastix pyriformis]
MFRTFVFVFPGDREVRQADGILVCYDCTSRAQFREVASLVPPRDRGHPVVGLVCTKCDLVETRQISRAEGEACAAALDATYWETSALTGQGVTECFMGLARAALRVWARTKEMTKEEKEKGCLIA